MLTKFFKGNHKMCLHVTWKNSKESFTEKLSLLREETVNTNNLCQEENTRNKITFWIRERQKNKKVKF